MAVGQQNRTTAVSILQIGFFHNTECADMTGFPWPGHIYLLIGNFDTWHTGNWLGGVGSTWVSIDVWYTTLLCCGWDKTVVSISITRIHRSSVSTCYTIVGKHLIIKSICYNSYIRYSRLFSLSANFPKFHELAHYSKKFILGVWLWVAIAKIGTHVVMFRWPINI